MLQTRSHSMRSLFSNHYLIRSHSKMLLKKEKVSKIVRKRHRRSTSQRRKSLEGLKRLELETAAVKLNTASLAGGTEKVLTDLDGILSDIAQAREVNKHVIRRNLRTHQLLDLMLLILNLEILQMRCENTLVILGRMRTHKVLDIMLLTD
ncbi:uncharacterized protein LOC119981331 isoform X2 [Tripterygium wilfordii]|uniref:uncharacterized protein LOC119981331 isoform X2 n=1 Tax=Tripterygium wilfordii TaxID=458696 RepID=UPI0018F83E94|nr:uncharacterized protein LOC119981331 isoform X2 [Tripterygium wilfordii]